MSHMHVTLKAGVTTMACCPKVADYSGHQTVALTQILLVFMSKRHILIKWHQYSSCDGCLYNFGSKGNFCRESFNGIFFSRTSFYILWKTPAKNPCKILCYAVVSNLLLMCKYCILSTPLSCFTHYQAIDKPMKKMQINDLCECQKYWSTTTHFLKGARQARGLHSFNISHTKDCIKTSFPNSEKEVGITEYFVQR